MKWNCEFVWIILFKIRSTFCLRIWVFISSQILFSFRKNKPATSNFVFPISFFSEKKMKSTWNSDSSALITSDQTLEQKNCSGKKPLRYYFSTIFFFFTPAKQMLFSDWSLRTNCFLFPDHKTSISEKRINGHIIYQSNGNF